MRLCLSACNICSHLLKAATRRIVRKWSVVHHFALMGHATVPVGVRGHPGQQALVAQHGEQRDRRYQHRRQQLQARRQPLRCRHACRIQ